MSSLILLKRILIDSLFYFRIIVWERERRRRGARRMRDRKEFFHRTLHAFFSIAHSYARWLIVVELKSTVAIHSEYCSYHSSFKLSTWFIVWDKLASPLRRGAPTDVNDNLNTVEEQMKHAVEACLITLCYLNFTSFRHNRALIKTQKNQKRERDAGWFSRLIKK